jgi:O-acetyl-ADP-ribose deacetylase (regulator of RNase III)
MRTKLAKIEIVKGNIVEMGNKATAVVCGCTQIMTTYGGINSAIRLAAGKSFENYLRGRRLKTADCIISPAYNMQYGHIVNISLPSLDAEEIEKVIENCFYNIIWKTAANKTITTINIPAGLIGDNYPINKVAEIMVRNVYAELGAFENKIIKKVNIVCLNEIDFAYYCSALDNLTK